MRDISFDPQALDALEKLVVREPKLADRLDEALDWIEEEPVNLRAKRRAFSDGKFAIVVPFHDEDWLIIWSENPNDPSSPIVFFIGESFL